MMMFRLTILEGPNNGIQAAFKGFPQTQNGAIQMRPGVR